MRQPPPHATASSRTVCASRVGQLAQGGDHVQHTLAAHGAPQDILGAAGDEFSNDMNMVGRAGGYALLGSVPLVLVWLIMCRLAPTLLIITTNLAVIASSVVTAIVLFTNPSGWSLTDSEAMVIAACRLCAHACNPVEEDVDACLADLAQRL